MRWADRLQEALSGRDSCEPLLDVIEHLPDAVTLSDAVRDDAGHAVDMRLLYMNAQARAGQPDPDAAVGNLCSVLWPDMVTNGSFGACMRVLDRGAPEAGNFEWRDAATYRPAGYDWKAVRLGDDILLWVLRDVSERLRHQQDSVEIYERVVQSLTTATIAHAVGDDTTTMSSVAKGLDAAKEVAGRELEAPVPGQGAPEVVAPATPHSVSGSIRTLLCDDDSGIRTMMRVLLERSGSFTIVADVEDGRAAVTAAETEQPDLVLMDLNMPGMSGLEAIPLVRRVAPGAVVVALSGLRAETAASDALAAGASTYIEKGTPIREMLDQLSALFSD